MIILLDENDTIFLDSLDDKKPLSEFSLVQLNLAGTSCFNPVGEGVTIFILTRVLVTQR